MTVLIVGVGAAIVVWGGGKNSRPATDFGHMHGLGVDPNDNALYAGTHYGLFRLPVVGGPVLVADRVQDFMGFTVVGPRHFLASGHPEQGSSGPSSLGLIESTDGGTHWTSLSLEGAADFHALQQRRGRIYGLNAMTGEFMVSEDKKTWQIRGRLPMADFAVRPTGAEIIVATTEQGLVRSTDGGRSFSAVPGPRLLAVDWAADGTLVGATPDGVLEVSGDNGSTWQIRGNLGGAPEALYAANGDQIYAAADGQILVSRDGGRTLGVWGR